MKKNILTSIMLFLSVLYGSAQSGILWQKCLGGTAYEDANAIQQTTDGGYIVANGSNSVDGDVTGNHGLGDCWIVKLHPTGIINWQKCLGGSDQDSAFSIQQTTDGGYIVAGVTYSTDGDVTGNHGGRDSWVVKLTPTGIIDWQKCLGGSADDDSGVIQQTTDGGYIIAGGTYSTDGDVTGNHGGRDSWVVKLSSTGTISWQKCLGGSGYDFTNAIQQTTDGGYIVTGFTSSTDGDVTGNHGGRDSWVVKLNPTGIIDWQKCLGGSADDGGQAIQQTTDGGYIVGGYTNSTDGDITDNHGGQDSWVVKLSPTGIIEWQKCLGGNGYEHASAIQQTTDDGFIVAGLTSSTNGDITGNHGGQDSWVVKLSSTGIIDWQKCMGGSADDRGYAIQQTTDGGYIVAGSTNSTDGDVIGNHGGRDSWVVKLDNSIGINENTLFENALALYPNPTPDVVRLVNTSEIALQTASIYNLEGKLIAEIDLTNMQKETSVDVSYLAAGVYMIEIFSENTSTVKKFIKKKVD